MLSRLQESTVNKMYLQRFLKRLVEDRYSHHTHLFVSFGLSKLGIGKYVTHLYAFP